MGHEYKELVYLT